MLAVISYDISENRRRTRVSKILRSFGERVQKSVFECHVSPTLLRKIKALIEEAILSDEDSVIYYVICKTCKNMRSTSGRNVVTEEIMEIII